MKMEQLLVLALFLTAPGLSAQDDDILIDNPDDMKLLLDEFPEEGGADLSSDELADQLLDDSIEESTESAGLGAEEDLLDDLLLEGETSSEAPSNIDSGSELLMEPETEAQQDPISDDLRLEEELLEGIDTSANNQINSQEKKSLKMSSPQPLMT